MAWQDGKSGGDSARRPPPQQLVFMPNFSNPVKDSKRSETRKMVAKYAMINRPRNSINPLPSPASSVSSSSSKHRTPSESTSPEPQPQEPFTPESFAPYAPSLSRHNSAHATAPSVAAENPAPQDYYSLPPLNDDLCHRYTPKNDYAHSRLDQAKLRNQAKLKVRRRVQEPTPPLNDPLRNDDAHGNDSNRSSITAVARRSSGMQDALAIMPSGPVTFLPAKKDPFDCLPIKHNPHTQELLYLYLNAHFLSPAFTQGSIEIPQRIKSYRQSTWFPLVLENPATLNALVAYIESTPDLPVKARTPDFLLNHVQAAYEGMRSALANPKTEIDDSICVAVILLMLTAQRIGDLTTFRAHATGLMQLLGARTKAFRQNKLLRDREHERWHNLNIKINGPPNPDPCKYCRDAHLRPEPRSPSPDSPGPASPVEEQRRNSSRGASPVPEPKIAPSHRRGEGFYHLIARGYLSPGMSGFIEQILIWSTLAEQARRDKLSAAAACSHAWIDERPGRLTALDTACQYSVRLCLYLSSWLEGGHSCSIVRRMTMAVYQSLRSPALDLPQLLRECPQVLLWLAFVAGPFADNDMPRQWLLCLLTRACAALEPSGNWNFEELMENTSSLFVWTTTMTPGAKRFWEENTWDAGTAAAWMENPF